MSDFRQQYVIYRHSIENDLVRAEQKTKVLISHANQAKPEQPVLSQVKRPAQVLQAQFRKGKLSFTIGKASQIDLFDGYRVEGLNLLLHLSIHHFEIGSPRFVASHNFGQALLQRGDVKGSSAIERDGLVIEEGTRRELLCQLSMPVYLLLVMR